MHGGVADHGQRQVGSFQVVVTGNKVVHHVTGVGVGGKGSRWGRISQIRHTGGK